MEPEFSSFRTALQTSPSVTGLPKWRTLKRTVFDLFNFTDPAVARAYGFMTKMAATLKREHQTAKATRHPQIAKSLLQLTQNVDKLPL